MREITQWQRKFLGLTRFPDQLSPLELKLYFTFPPDDITYIITRYEPQHQIGVALQLGFLRMTGCFLTKVPRTLPAGLLQRLADQFQLPQPRIASLRSLYKNKKTTWELHQKELLRYTGFRKMTDKQHGSLTAHLKREAKRKADVHHLIQSGLVWMYQRGFLNFRSKVDEKADKVLAASSNALYQLIMATVTTPQLEAWEKRLLSEHPEEHATWLQWLATPPRGKLTMNLLKERIHRVLMLHDIGVQNIQLAGVALEKIKHYALEMKAMKPSKFAELKDDELRALRLVCFLRNCLTTNTDTAVAMTSRMVSSIWRKAVEAAKEKDAEVAIAARSLLNEIQHLYHNKDLPLETAWVELGKILARDTTRQFKTRSAAARFILTDPNSPVRAVLQELDKLLLQFGSNAGAAHDAMLKVRGLWGKKRPQLEPGTFVTVNKCWKELLDDPDRERAFRALECATLFMIRKGLRNGSIYIETSTAFRSREDLLIGMTEWEKYKTSYYDNLDLPLDPNSVLEKMVAELRKGTEILSAQVLSGELTIRDGAIQFPALRARDYPQEWDTAVESFGNRLPIVQLPDLMLEIDAAAGVTKTLLGRHARSEDELLQVYGGMLAHACALDATAVALMVPGLTAEQVKIGQRLFYDAEVVRAASDAVSSYHRQFEVTKSWGDGTMASADMAAIDISDKIWEARLDPKRNVPSYGVYTTLSDQGTIIYGQPIPLNIRQAGPALESVVRQREVEVDQLAVDTHGYTDFAFGAAKNLHIDLCPQFKSMRDRKIHLPTKMAILDGLEPICNNTIGLRHIRDNWDQLVRIAGSIETGQVSATIALAKFGSAAQGDPVYTAGVAFGRLCRSLFLCSYYINDDFRHAVKNILSQGESVHRLQRSIYTGNHAKPKGQEEEHMVAVSLSLTLVTNMVMAWNTARIQEMVDDNGTGVPEWMQVMRPARDAHVNFRGTMKFPVGRYASRLIASGPRRAVA